MKKITQHLIIAGIASIVASTAQAQTVDFDDIGDLDTFFNATGTRTDKYTETDAIGLGGTRGLQVINSGSQGNRVSKTAFGGDAITEISMAFQFGPVEENQGGTGFFIGFSASDTYSVSLGNGGGDEADNFLLGIGGTFSSSNNPNPPIGERRLLTQNKVDGVISQQVSSNFVLTSGNWYELRMDVTNFDVNGYDITFSLWDEGANRDVDSPIASVVRSDLVNADLSGGNVYAFFGGQGAADDRIGLNYDNFVAVPEPSAYALISGALALGWIMIRRRR